MPFLKIDIRHWGPPVKDPTYGLQYGPHNGAPSYKPIPGGGGQGSTRGSVVRHNMFDDGTALTELEERFQKVETLPFFWKHKQEVKLFFFVFFIGG